MSVIRALLFSYWLLVALPVSPEGAAIARPLESDNSTVQGAAGEGSGEPEPWMTSNSTVNSTTLCLEEKEKVQEEDSRQVRLSNIKAQILAKFGLTGSPAGPANTPQLLDERTMSTYYELLLRQSVSESASSEDEDECSRIKGGKSSFYAKELRVHFPTSFRPVVPSVETFEWGSLFKSEITKRNADGKDDGKPPEKETSKNPVDNGDTVPPGSSDGPLTTAADENPTVPATEGDQPPLYSEAEIKILQTYIAPLVYKLTFSDLALSQSEVSSALSAELRLYKRKKILDNPQIKQDTNPTEKVQIFRVWNSTGDDGMGFQFVTSENVGSERDEFIAFNVTSAIKDWQTAGNRSIPLRFEVLVQSPQSVASGLSFLPSIEFDVPNFGKGEHNAQLIVAVPTLDNDSQTLQQSQDADSQNGGNRRRRRQTLEGGISSSYCRRNPNETNCCIRDLIINFHRDLNMTWILAPRSVQVNYCEGSCPDYWPTATHSTTLLAKFRESNPLAAPAPCCVASSTSPITMVVAINNRIYFNHVPDMVVNSCICR